MKMTLSKATLILAAMALSGSVYATSIDDNKAKELATPVSKIAKAEAVKLQNSPEAKALKERHKAEWDAMKKAHEAIKANWGNMSEADQKRATTEMKAEAEALKKRHKAELASLKS
jgi:outer membrane murein-binding lipoprotein Lpp